MECVSKQRTFIFRCARIAVMGFEFSGILGTPYLYQLPKFLSDW